MTTNGQQASTKIPAGELRLLAGVEPRVFRSTLILGITGAVALWLWRGTGWAVGFAVGAALSGLSFQWMQAAISAIAERIASDLATSGQRHARKPGSAGAVARFVLRYALIGIAGYVIFRSSAVSLAAFFAGLFVSIAAVLVEIGYQIYLGFRSR
ncbi:MAG: ATP synthase subunit I [Acidobacteria bacterium]|nr:ATP synthase subunit I [Acidobacteriota bacterium]